MMDGVSILGSRGQVFRPWLTLFLVALAIALFVIGGPAPEALVFDRDAIRAGEFWRWITGHWVHSDLSHALWDISALLILSLVLERISPGRILVVLIAGTVGVDIWLAYSWPGLQWYCGLSGVLNALLAAILVQFWFLRKKRLAILMGLAAVLKIIIEMHSGQSLVTQTAWPSVPQAHAAGFIAGFLIVVMEKAFLFLKQSRRGFPQARLPSRTSSDA